MIITNPIRIGDTGQEFSNKINDNFHLISERLVTASESELGFVRVGENLDIDSNGVLSALSGLLSTVEEINLLMGVSGNVQEQIDALDEKDVGHFVFIEKLYASLTAIENNYHEGDIAIVLESEENDGMTTAYAYNNNEWSALGEVKVRLRDFSNDPINLESEVDGILPRSKLQKINIKRTIVFYFQGFFGEPKSISIYASHKGELDSLEILLPKALSESLSGKVKIGEEETSFTVETGKTFLLIPMSGQLDNAVCSVSLISGEELEGTSINLNFMEEN